MTPEIVSTDAFAIDGLTFIASDDSVWLTFLRPKWDVASWLWWWLYPGKKGFVLLRIRGEKLRVRTRCVRVASTHVRLGVTP